MVVLPPSGHDENVRYLVVCNQTRHQLHPAFSGQVSVALRNRHVAIFICGDFDMEDATKFVNAFLVESQGLPVPMADFFPNPSKIDVKSVAWSLASADVLHSAPLRHLMDNFSMVELTDSYTYHLLFHMAQTYFGSAIVPVS